MSELADLHARVLAEPDDDAARLVYADALTEAGDPRGEFITTQCTLAAAGIHELQDLVFADVPDAEVVRLAGLLRRVNQLQAEHAAAWSRALFGDVEVRITYRRGLPHALQVDAKHAVRVVGALGPTPIRELQIGNELAHPMADALTALAENPPARLRTLDVMQPRLADSSLLAHLFTQLPKLEGFGIFGNGVVGNETFKLAIDVLAPLQGLTDLRLDKVGLDRAGLDELARLPAAPKLRRIAIGMAPIGDDAIAVLDGRFPAAAKVSLFLCGITSAAFARPLQIPRVLSFGGNKMGQAGLEALLEQPTIENLEELVVDAFCIGDVGAAAIARSRRLASLRKLDLSQNGVGDRGMAELAMSASAHLHAIRLSQTSVRAAGLAALLESPCHSLRELYYWPPQPPEGRAIAEALVRSRNTLRHVELHECGLDDAAFELIATSPNLASLRSLKPSENRMNNRGARGFAQRPVVRLHAYSNQIRGGGYRAWLESAALVELSTDPIADPELDAALRARFGTAFHLARYTYPRGRTLCVVFAGTPPLTPAIVREVVELFAGLVVEASDGDSPLKVRDTRQADAEPFTINIARDWTSENHPLVPNGQTGLATILYRDADHDDLVATVTAIANALAVRTGGIAYKPEDLPAEEE